MEELNEEFGGTQENPREGLEDGLSNDETSSSSEGDTGSTPDEDFVPREQYNKLYARAKRAEELLKKTKGEGRKTDYQDKKTTDKEDNDKEWKERIEFLVKNKDYNLEEIEVVSAFARGKGVSLEEAAKDEAVSAAISALREKKKAEQATIASNSRSSTDDNSLLGKFRKGELSEEEFKANWRQIAAEVVRNKKGQSAFE